jgi:ABC-type uncharacterized transport system permease subunit
MILSAEPEILSALLAIVGYVVAALSGDTPRRWPAQVLLASWLVHGFMLVAGTGVWSANVQGVRIGFAPVLSLTVWLVLALHGIESRFFPFAGVRRALALLGAAAVTLALVFPGDVPLVAHSELAPLHFALGLTSYGLFGAAVLHAVLLDTAERRLRLKSGTSGLAFGMPLLKLERLTFHFVDAGFVVLTLTLLLGLTEPAFWHWGYKTVLSLLGWATFAGLIIGRRFSGWRGRQATRWLYAGTLLLLLAYVGSRFVFEVVLQRPVN